MVKAGSGRAYYVGFVRCRAGEAIAACACWPAAPTNESAAPIASVHDRDQPPDLVSALHPPRSDQTAHHHADPEEDQTFIYTLLVTVLRYGRKSRQVELPVRLSALHRGRDARAV